MKELNKMNVYDLSRLSNEQKTELYIYLDSIDNKIDLKLLNLFIYYSIMSDKWTVTDSVFENDSMVKDAVELFEEEEKPSQYKIGIDTFKRCESNMTKDEILACCKFNIDKYNWRKKGQDKEDFEKIINYAKWALEQLK